MTAPITVQCGIVRLELHELRPGMWQIRHGGESVGVAVQHRGGVEASTDQTAVTQPTVEQAAVRLAQLLNDDGFVPVGRAVS